MAKNQNKTTVKPKFLDLWPTQFMEMSLPGHETANSVIADIVLSNNSLEINLEIRFILIHPIDPPYFVVKFGTFK